MAAATGNNARPIIIKKVKKVSGGHHGGAWKVAYADFVTAMMAFFMLLWLLSVPDKDQLKALADYFSPSNPSTSTTIGADGIGTSQGLGGRMRDAQASDRNASGEPSAQSATIGVARGGTADIPDAAMRVLASELQISLDPVQASDADANAVRVETDAGAVRITLMDSARRSMFREGSADLNGFARARLTEIASKIGETSASVAIEGHTDGIGGNSEVNWRLSGERALAAREAMVSAGLGPERFRGLTAKGSSEPLYPDQPDRPENRRITIVILAEAPVLPDQASFTF